MNTTTHRLLTRSDERMHTKIDWLDSRHSFSFGGHYDPERMGFGPLRHQPSAKGRGLWLFVIEGRVAVAGETLESGDSLASASAGNLEVSNPGADPAKIILFDLPLRD